MRTLLATIVICVAISTGLKTFASTVKSITDHNQRLEVAMTSLKR